MGEIRLLLDRSFGPTVLSSPEPNRGSSEADCWPVGLSTASLDDGGIFATGGSPPELDRG